MDREKAISGLVKCLDHDFNCGVNGKECPYYEHGTYLINVDCIDRLMADALALLKGSFTPQEVYDTVIEHAQHDTRFRLGDKIDYSFSDVVDILNMELMCKAGDM